MTKGRATDLATTARVVAVVLPLLALVALAADAGVPWVAGEPAARSDGSGSGDGRYVAVGIVLAATAAATFLLVRSWQRRRREAAEADEELEGAERRPTRALDRFLVSLLAYLLLGLVVAGFFFAAREAVRWLPEDERTDTVAVQEDDPAAAARTSRADLTWLLTAAVLVLAVAAATTALWSPTRRRLRRQGFASGHDEAERPADALVALVDETVDDLRAERDARKAIIAAYARMERGLARKGVPRRPWEAPLEYLRRVLVERRADAAHVARLTDLFERAKFSREELRPAAKADAIDCLLAIRREVQRTV